MSVCQAKLCRNGFEKVFCVTNLCIVCGSLEILLVLNRCGMTLQPYSEEEGAGKGSHE